MGFGQEFAQGVNSGLSAGINMKMMKKLSAGHTQTPIKSVATSADPVFDSVDEDTAALPSPDR